MSDKINPHGDVETIVGISDSEQRIYFTETKVTHVTPEAADVMRFQAQAQIEIAAHAADGIKAQAEADRTKALAERDKHVYSVVAFAVAFVVVMIILMSALLLVGQLSDWNPWIVGPIAALAAAILLGATPALIKWLMAKLGG